LIPHAFLEKYMITESDKIKKSENAKNMAIRQARYDRLHHLKRLVWLRSDTPLWSCGTPLAPFEIQQLIEGSEEVLASNMVSNSVDTSDLTYIAELDAFAIANGL
jgi:hypothetical protein